LLRRSEVLVLLRRLLLTILWLLAVGVVVEKTLLLALVAGVVQEDLSQAQLLFRLERTM
jgi:hypothetical protein